MLGKKSIGNFIGTFSFTVNTRDMPYIGIFFISPTPFCPKFNVDSGTVMNVEDIASATSE